MGGCVGGWMGVCRSLEWLMCKGVDGCVCVQACRWMCVFAGMLMGGCRWINYLCGGRREER